MRSDSPFPDSDHRRDYIRGVFERVASRYDLMNDLMSLGLHRAWKQGFADRIVPKGATTARRKILDMACGSGDIALRCFSQSPEATEFTLCDSNPDMLRLAQKRIEKLGLEEQTRKRLRLLCAEAECLPFPDRSFDAYSIAFGIRNATDIEAALRESYRVLRPGGRFFCLEFSKPHLPGLEQAYGAYSEYVIPALGQIVVGDAKPYRYLVESIRRFPTPRRFLSMIEMAGFSRASYERLGGGIVALHQAWRL